VNVQLCKKSIERLGAGMKPLISALRDQEHSLLIKDCLDRCMACDKGLIIAAADGMPLSAAAPDKLLASIAALAEDD
jgi:uncharacterized protein YuzB (UPF0349 family)